MDFVALIGIAVGLSMDAFAVSVTNGAVCQKNNLKFAAKLALSFGFFQALMPTIGWLAGKAAEKLFLKKCKKIGRGCKIPGRPFVLWTEGAAAEGPSKGPDITQGGCAG